MTTALALDRTHIGLLSAGISITWALSGSFADAHGYSAAWLSLSIVAACGIVPALVARRLIKTRAASPGARRATLC